LDIFPKMPSNRFLLLLILSIALSFVLADSDCYHTLGIARDANDQAIRKAFKKLSLK